MSNIGYHTTYLLVESNFTEGCVCLTLGYLQVTGTMSGSTKVFLSIMCSNLPSLIPSKKKKLYPRHMNHIYIFKYHDSKFLNFVSCL